MNTTRITSSAVPASTGTAQRAAPPSSLNAVVLIGVGENVHPALEAPAGVLVERDQFGHTVVVPSMNNTWG